MLFKMLRMGCHCLVAKDKPTDVTNEMDKVISYLVSRFSRLSWGSSWSRQTLMNNSQQQLVLCIKTRFLVQGLLLS